MAKKEKKAGNKPGQQLSPAESNRAAAIAATRAVGVDDRTIGEGLASFHGLPHRLEFVVAGEPFPWTVFGFVMPTDGWISRFACASRAARNVSS